ncbi:MAG: tetratricopeptide repeat protein [Opitutaceae bacterium]|nr:tetratricopeptide repeat protein [Opitutaceae bacterium]
MKLRLWLPGWALLAAVVVAYIPTYRAGFVWNDSDYVTAPPLRSLEGLGKIWTKLGATEQYYPALHSAFWIQHRLWGDSPIGYHLTTVALHAFAALLLWRVLLSLGVRGAWIGATLFALHPVCVESVAWISEQKNTLSLFLYLAAALAYLRHRHSPSPVRYGVATGIFVAALLSKSVCATLPAALLVVLWWQKGRITWRDMRPLVPWFIAGAAFGLFSAWVEHTIVGAKGESFDLGWAARFALSGRIVWFYLGKLLWPTDLIFIYPRWTIDAANAIAWIPLVGTLVLLAAAWLYRRHNRAPLAALLFFLGSLFPVMGFMNVYGFNFSYVADHWQYLPCIAPLALAGSGLSRLPERGRQSAGIAIRAGTAALLIVLGGLTWRQSESYHDVETLYRSTLAGNPDSWMSHTNLALLLLDAGKANEAISHLQAAARLRPRSAEVANNLGVALRQANHLPEAEQWFRSAIQLRPEYPEAEYNLAMSLLAAGSTAQARTHLERAVALRPSYAAAHNQLGALLLAERKLTDALTAFERALAAAPDFPDAEHNLALTLIALDRRTEAIRHLESALRQDPDRQESRWLLAVMLAAEKRPAEAMRRLRELIAAQPTHADAHLLLAQLLDASGEHAEALRFGREGQRLKHTQAEGTPQPK